MNRSEHDIQVAFFRLVRYYRDQGYEQFNSVFAVPNGGERNSIVAANLSYEGTEPGVPDVLVLHPSLEGISETIRDDTVYMPILYTFMCIEFKSPEHINDKSSIVDYSQMVKRGRSKNLVPTQVGPAASTLGCSDYQLAMATTLVENGARYIVCSDWLDAWNELCTYLQLEELKQK